MTTLPDIDLSLHDWNEVIRVLREHLPDYEVWAFGSRVKGTAKPYSDLDLVIASEQPVPIATMAELRDALVESDLTIKVDVVDWATTSRQFREIILENRVLVKKKLVQ